MNPLIGLLAILGFGFLIQNGARLLLWIFFPEKKEKKVNPYVQMHQIKDENDVNYDAYLKWLDKKGHGVPLPKFKTPEDIVAEKKIKSSL